MSTDAALHLAEEEWLPLAQAHEERVRPLIDGRLDRRARGESNAVEDFLFDYYPYSPGKLATWHPGLGVVLHGGPAQAYLARAGYRPEDTAVTADIAWLEPRRPRLELAIRILSGTASRPPMTGCFALHEWAMVYRLGQEQVRHSYLPLRLTPEEIADTVDAWGLRCTHIDAFRFFTPEAIPLNSLTPTRATQPDLDQPGCLHASMDLYKYAFWFSPLVPSDLVMDCFAVAAQAREIDMRASPYDVSPFGLAPLRVETPEGRSEYAEAQRLLIEGSAPLRERLSATLETLSHAMPEPAMA